MTWIKHRDEPCTPEEIVANCERYGIDPARLHEVSEFWRHIVTHKYRRKGKRDINEVRPWTYIGKSGKSGRVPFPPGVERYSPEHHRIHYLRRMARKRAKRDGTDPFLEGYHNLDTYVPVLSTKRNP